jgi:hypothetical protein
LSEKLTEVIESNARLDGHAGKRGIVTHRTERFLPLVDERAKEEVKLLERVASGLKTRVGRDGRFVEFDGGKSTVGFGRGDE